jgi:hypothetical protein
MPVFEFDDPKVKVTVVDEPTVGQQLSFTGSMMSARLSDDFFTIQWAAIQPLIEDWECDVFPDRSVPLSEVTDPLITNVIVWACSKVTSFINDLGAVPKKRNSSGGGSGDKGNKSDS